MNGGFDHVFFFRRVRAAWRFIGAAVVAAMAIAAGVSLVLPKQYTATASLLIDPPAGNDPRAATAVSPVYMESLKTYEKVASSDTLFLHALERCAPGELKSGRPIEALKKRILRVAKPQNTKVLEIRATLGDPRAAQAMAAFVAEETVRLSERIDTSSEAEITESPRKLVAGARGRLDGVRKEHEAFAESGGTRDLENELFRQAELKADIEADLARAQTDLAGYVAAEKSQGPDGSRTQEIAATRARIEELTRKRAEMETATAARTRDLEVRRYREESLEAEEKSARTEYETAANRLNEILGSEAFRSERLHILDPGVTPQKPSSPNLLLNVGAAGALALLGCLLYLAAMPQSERVAVLESKRHYAVR